MGEVSETVDGALSVLKGERAERRERLKAALVGLKKVRNADSKGVRRLTGMLEDCEIFDGFVDEHGGDEMALRCLLARVVEGENLREVAGHYGIGVGFLWEFLSEDEERLRRYYAAQAGVAEVDMGDTVGIADGTDPDMVGVSNLRIKARQARAAAYNRGRFGASVDVKVGVVVDVRLALEEAKRRVAAREVQDADVVSDKPAASIAKEQMWI